MKKLNLKVPHSYSELKPEQLEYIAGLFLDPGNKVQMLLRAFIYLSGLKVIKKKSEKDKKTTWYWVQKDKQEPTMVSGSDLVTAANHVKWILDLDNIILLPRIGSYKAVDHRMYNGTLDQYLMIENYFEAYQVKKDELFLDCLMAVIYQAPWQKYQSAKIRSRSAAFSKMPAAKKQTVILWILSFRKYLKEAYPYLYSSGGSSGNMRDNIQMILRGLNKGDITKNSILLDKPVHDALAELNAMARDAKEYDKKIKDVRR